MTDPDRTRIEKVSDHINQTDQVVKMQVVEKKRRRKRSLDEVTVEVMLTADKTMVKSFRNKADLQSYIITIMGMVSNFVFCFSSMSFLTITVYIGRSRRDVNIRVFHTSQALKAFEDREVKLSIPHQ